MDYKDKYLKYKSKYLQLKLNNQKGGNKKKNRPSPSESATLFKIGTKKKGNDGNIYIIVTNKNGVKRWKLHKKMEIKKKLNKKISLTTFYDIDVIKPKKLNDYINNNNLLKKIKDKIIPELKKQKINFYFVPLPTKDGRYWIDFPNSYINEFYDNNYLDKNFVYLVIYMKKNLTLNLKKPFVLNYNLNLEQKQIVFDIFYKHLPFNYEWSGNDSDAMVINHKKTKKKLKI